MRLVIVVVLTFIVVVIISTAPAWSVEPTPYKAFIPNIEDAELKSLVNDPGMEWYTENEMPKLFQHDFTSPGACRFISIYKDIGPGGPRFSNGNGEWPWSHPGTPKPNPQAKAIMGARVLGVRLFDKPVQQFELVVTHRSNRRNTVYVEKQGQTMAKQWSFGTGTEFIEINLNRVAGYDRACFIHRMTMMESGEWKFRVYRPFTNRESYEKATNTKTIRLGKMRMIDNNHTIKAFNESREMESLPRVNETLVAKLLDTTPFKLCKDEDFIPTTDFDGQIYPAVYLGKFIGNATDQTKCRNCHRDVLTNVRKFASGEWYGQIRGGGHDRQGSGVFSWLPRRYRRVPR